MRYATRTMLALVSAVLLLAAGLAAQKPDSAQALLRAATDKALVDGDLNGAIKQYQTIVDTFKTDRAVVATALVRMAECYQKLGDPESQKVYQRVVREYADQTEPASQARARLAILAQNKTSDSRASGEKAGAIVEELQVASSQDLYALSPDGTMLAYTAKRDGNGAGNLVVRDVVSGRETQVTDLKTGCACGPVWSPDGKKIVYTDWQGNYWKYELHIVSLATGENQHREINGFAHDWSKDGRFILHSEGGLEKPRWTLNLLPVEGGPVRQIMNEDASIRERIAGLRLSQDGKYVAYSLEKDRASNVFLLPLQGGESIRITEGSAIDYAPIWAPDGKTLVFISNRALGRWDLWGVRVLEGKPANEPFAIKPDVGRVRLLSLTENGRLLMLRSELRKHIYVTDVDPETSQAIGEAVRLTKDSDFDHSWPMWSPDGRYIAYTVSDALRVMSADGSKGWELTTLSRGIHQYAWAPDSDHIYLIDRRPESGNGVYSISLSTKEIKPILLDPEIIGHPDVSPDGKHLAFLKGLQTQQNLHIYMADIDGKNVRQLTFETVSKVVYPAWSPDGKQLAFYKYGAGDRRTSLWVLNVDDGRFTNVFEGMNSEHSFWDPAWSPDGKKIVWWSLDGSRDGFEIRFISVAPGEKPQLFRPNLGSPVKIPMYFPRWSPDGKKMVFSAGMGVRQVLLMENFLPKSEAPEKR